MKILSLILILLTTSCSIQKRANRKIDWLKQHGFASGKRDTLVTYLPEYRDTGKTKLSIELDTIKEWYSKDTCYTETRVNKILNNAKVKPISIDNDSISLNIKVENGEIKYDLRVKPRKIEIPYEKLELKPTIEQKWWDKFWIGFSVAILIILLLLYIVYKLINLKKET